MEQELLSALGLLLQARQRLSDAITKAAEDRNLKDSVTIVSVEVEIAADKLRNIITEHGFFTF